jgi:Zn-dependent M28 family amino/carboxypeptidase
VPKIALIQRGTCSFGDKVLNAQTAGYAGAIIFNEGQPGRDTLITGTLGVAVKIPAVSIDYADGAALYAAAESGGATAHLVTHTQNTPNTDTFNIIADSKGGDPNHVLLVGAYLDALPSGPGINENGSGVSTALEIAKQISKLHLDPKYKIRFIFYGAEQVRARRTANSESIGLLGSNAYVESLSKAALGKIFATVNLDTLGAANYVRFVDNGDGPTGSALITNVFTDYFAAEGLATELHEPPSFDGTSIGPLEDAGIPVGGLFGGAAEIKTPAEAATFGGTAGVSYDACYHQACDDISNVGAKPLGEFGGAAAYGVWTLANTDIGLIAEHAPKPALQRPAAVPASGWTGAPDAG